MTLFQILLGLLLGPVVIFVAFVSTAVGMAVAAKLLDKLSDWWDLRL